MDKKLGLSFALLKSASSKTKDLAVKLNKKRPNEVKLSAAGTALGAVGGATLIGGMGVALLGTAVAVSGAAVVGGLGLMIGNKIGSELDRRKAAKVRDLDKSPHSSERWIEDD